MNKVKFKIEPLAARSHPTLLHHTLFDGQPAKNEGELLAAIEDGLRATLGGFLAADEVEVEVTGHQGKTLEDGTGDDRDPSSATITVKATKYPEPPAQAHELEAASIRPEAIALGMTKTKAENADLDELRQFIAEAIAKANTE